MLKLKRALEHWKEQAGLTPEQRARVDLEDVSEVRETPEQPAT